MRNGTLGDSQIFFLCFWSIYHEKGELLMKAEALLGIQSQSQWNLEAQLLAELFKAKFRYIRELGRRFSQSIQEFLMLWGFHNKRDF